MSGKRFEAVVLANDLLTDQQDDAMDAAFPDWGKVYVWDSKEAAELAATGDFPLVLAPDLHPHQVVRATLLAQRFGVQLRALMVSPDVPGEWVVQTVP